MKKVIAFLILLLICLSTPQQVFAQTNVYSIDNNCSSPLVRPAGGVVAGKDFRDQQSCRSAAVTSATNVTRPNSGITNPALDSIIGGNAKAASEGSTFSSYLITVWRGLIVIGGLAVILNLVTGAFHWITAGGEQSKVAKAREQMTNAVMGMIILAGSFLIVAFLERVFGLSILRFTVPTP